MPAGGMSDGADPFRINAISFGIGPHPAHRALDIVEWRGSAVATFDCQPVVDGKTDVSLMGERPGTLGKRFLAPGSPAAAMHPDQRWSPVRGF